MTNEIKKISNKYKMYMSFDGNEYEMVQKAELHKLLDYITNLQEENERLKKQYAKEEKKLFRDNEILQQRIDKAIKYIKKNKPYWEEWHYDGCCVDDGIEDILKILRGDE